MKLPIQNFLAVEEIEAMAPQIALINAVNDPIYRQVVACLSRRTGKTYISNTIAFLKAMEPSTAILIVSPNYSLTNISWNLQIQKLESHGIEIKSRNKTDREIHLMNGSMIKFGSVSQADSLVGRSYDLILFDEAALDKNGEDCYNIQLRPTLDKVGSKVIFISTPRGGNYFKKFYERGFSSEFPTWVSIHSTWRDNPRMTSEDVSEAERSMSRAEFKQEYEAEFTTFEGQIYEDFNHDSHIRPVDVSIFDRDKFRYERIMGIDPGWKDPTGGVLCYYDNLDDHFYFVWDYCKAGRNTAAHCAVFGPLVEEHEVDMIFVDSAAAQFREDMATMFDIPSNAAKKSVLDGIMYVQSLLQSGRITVDPSCTHIIDMFTNYRWDSNENLIKPKPIHDTFSHVADALRYALYSLSR